MITTDKAIERLAYTITKQNKPNQTDLDSLKVIAEFVEKSKKQEIRNNYLFAKMYVYNFIHEVLYYNESYKNNYKFSQLQLHRTLNNSLENIIKIAMDKLNTHEYQLLIEGLGITSNHFIIRNLEQIENDKEITENNKEILLKFAKGFYEYEDFEEKIKDQIVFCINKFKDLP